jgi:hypothetical protein
MVPFPRPTAPSGLQAGAQPDIGAAGGVEEGAAFRGGRLFQGLGEEGLFGAGWSGHGSAPPGERLTTQCVKRSENLSRFLLESRPDAIE